MSTDLLKTCFFELAFFARAGTIYFLGNDNFNVRPLKTHQTGKTPVLVAKKLETKYNQ